MQSSAYQGFHVAPHPSTSPRPPKLLAAFSFYSISPHALHSPKPKPMQITHDHTRIIDFRQSSLALLVCLELLSLSSKPVVWMVRSSGSPSNGPWPQGCVPGGSCYEPIVGRPPSCRHARFWRRPPRLIFFPKDWRLFSMLRHLTHSHTIFVC